MMAVPLAVSAVLVVLIASHVPATTEPNVYNASYLEAKATRLGHKA